jgi:N-acylneuraminate cytidylyltransferase
MKDIIIIPARGGSKGILDKNIKLLNGRPLIYYTLDVACAVASSENICVSTDSEEIIRIVREYGLDVPFKRPAQLATDTVSNFEVALHALVIYKQGGLDYDRVILLQPTSPFRTATHVREALSLYQPGLDMVVSVKNTKANPYFTLFEENSEGSLTPSMPGNFMCRQDCPVVYEYNGAIYILSVQSLQNESPKNFSKIRKYLMSEEDSLDIDTHYDWTVAEAILRAKDGFLQ